MTIISSQEESILLYDDFRLGMGASHVLHLDEDLNLGDMDVHPHLGPNELGLAIIEA